MVDLPWWLWPFLATLILIAIHTYFGLHVISRKVLFVDLAIAQIAALGGTVAFLFGFELADPVTYGSSLLFGVMGAWIFAITRTRGDRVPHEAIIGLAFAIASAGAILTSAENPHGAEHLRDMLAGSILVVTPREVAIDLVLYSAIGGLHWALRRPLMAVSLDPEGAARRGLRVERWDFLFYVTFAVVVTMSVHIAGVLLVFCLLIAPAVCGALFSEAFRVRLVIGWLTSIAAAVLGLVVSAHFDWPPAPSIIAVYAVILVGAGVAAHLLGAEDRRAALVRIGASILVLGALGASLILFLRSDFAHNIGGGDLLPIAHDEVHPKHEGPEHGLGTSQAEVARALHDEHASVRAHAAERIGIARDPADVPLLVEALSDRSTDVREKVAEALGRIGSRAAIPALEAALAVEGEDEWVRLREAEALVRCGGDGMKVLFDLAERAEAGVVRREALRLTERLRK
jgi:zinc/manganese transport system permease protein